MFLLMIIEGPVITLTAAFLSSIGIFNVYTVLVLSILGDIIGDVILYSIGYFGRNSTLTRARRFFRISDGFFNDLEKKFLENSRKIIFSVKSTTGLCGITFILAGAIRMKFSKFIFYSLLGGVIWSTFIVIIGYFFGYMAREIDQYFQYTGWVVFVLAVLLIIIILKRKRIKEKI